MLHKSDSAAASSLSLALPHVAASASCAGDYPEGNATGVVAGTSMELSHPRLCLIVEGCIAQAMPEHPKREHVLSLSTAFGDAYLLQATSKEEMDAWVAAFHTACASLFARQRGKVDTVRLLRSEIAKLECSVDLDGKMRTMAELQLSAVRDTRSRQTITRDIEQWEENVERLIVELYRHRCYLASLLGNEMPNPKSILSSISKPTKQLLSRVGPLNVTSFHALSLRPVSHDNRHSAAQSRWRRRKCCAMDAKVYNESATAVTAAAAA
uniref:PH domain-containing protein n=1 Tax=Macrostomum lignano TaxID=282301 RepID=A0A1I8FUM5_9PLAT